MGSNLTPLVWPLTLLLLGWPALYLAFRYVQLLERAQQRLDGHIPAGHIPDGPITAQPRTQTVSTQRPAGEESQADRATAEAKLAEHLQREYANQGRQVLPGEAAAQAKLMLDSVIW
jgi:hypothetical protein